MEQNIRILVAHPVRQYSDQLVQGLHKADMLFEYWTGIPAHAQPSPPVIGPLLARLSQYDEVPVRKERVRHCFISPVVNQIVQRVLPSRQAVAWMHRGQYWFDRWCARRLPIDIEAVVCYENAALETFQHAKKRGRTTILDAASFHHRWQDQFYDYVESDDAHAIITRRKDKEIALADHILTVSEFARESYLDAGVPEEKVTSVPLGCDLSRFANGGRRGSGSNEPFTFIFAGSAGKRKGVDVLLKASQLIRQEGISHRVITAGSVSSDIPWEQYDSVERVGRVPQEKLAELFRKAECFVLPSRHDSFGMVVVEAMASGLPVIVSDHVGAKELVDEDKTGWIVPAEDVEALARQMRWCIDERDRLPAIGEKASEAAQQYSWEAYYRRVVDVIGEVV